MHPDADAPTAPNACWTNTELLRMLQDAHAEVPALILKYNPPHNPDTWVEIRRVWDDVRKYALIEKRYKGRISHFAQRELEYLGKMNGNSGMKYLHTLRYLSMRGGSAIAEPDPVSMVVRTQWMGLDTNAWAQLLRARRSATGVALPQYCFTRHAPAVLAWVRGVLRSMYKFHELGFVHCDLLARNIVISFDPVEGQPRQFVLKLGEPYIIDLELCLGPVNIWDGNEPSPRTGWRYRNGDVVWHNPTDRSEYLCPGPVQKPLSDHIDTMGRRRRQGPGGRAGVATPGRKYHGKPDGGGWVKHENPFGKLPQVDWGADLFSLGVALREMIREEDFCIDPGDDTKIVEFLYTLPTLLRSFEALAPQGQTRKMPHNDLIREIDRYIGIDTCDRYLVTVPDDYADYEPVNDYPSILTYAPPEPSASQVAEAKRDAMLPANETVVDATAPSVQHPQPPHFPGQAPSVEALKRARLDWCPALVTVESMNLAVAIDPVTEPGFAFKRTPANGARPKVNVTRAQIESYLAELNRRLGLPTASLSDSCDRAFRQSYPGFRLLSFEEWIDICRTGFDSPNVYAIGQRGLQANDLRPEHAVYDWSAGETLAHTRPPSQKPQGPQPTGHASNCFNRWGVRAMHGNVWELVTHSADGPLRACGGAADSLPHQLGWDWWEDRKSPHEKSGNTGFRVCRTLQVFKQFKPH